jgi:KaiC/GvpD/RAD55 family RecA-like ATPase
VKIITVKIMRASMGIKELDEILHGGLPIPSALLILGEVGTGKSVLCQQFVYSQAKEGFKCTYFCIDNSPYDVRLNMSSLGWDPEDLEEKDLIRFVDLFVGREEASEEKYQGNPRDFDELTSTIRKFFMQNQRFVVDSISSIAFLHGEAKAYDLIQRIHGWIIKTKSVGIVNAVKGMHSQSFEIAIQQALGNAIILEKEEEGVYLRVAKTTRTSHQRGKFGLEIDESGIRILI